MMVQGTFALLFGVSVTDEQVCVCFSGSARASRKGELSLRR